MPNHHRPPFHNLTVAEQTETSQRENERENHDPHKLDPLPRWQCTCNGERNSKCEVHGDLAMRVAALERQMMGNELGDRWDGLG